MPLSTGQVLNRRYRIVKLLGQGGFGAVYRAWDTTFELACAIKENSQTSPEGQRQFLREARILRTLRHPNLPEVSDLFVVPDPSGGSGSTYLVMDFVEGDDLEEKLCLNRGPLDEAQALTWTAQICDALAYLHSQNPPIIHRDIKPANIKITPDGRAMLVDFGIAKMYDPSMRTTVGARAVTPGYSPLEQYGLGGQTDGRADIYALGATLYALLTGEPPVEATQRSPSRPLTPPRALNPKVSPDIEAALLKALAIYPEDRFAGAAEFKAALMPRPGAVHAPVQPVSAPRSAAGTVPVPQVDGLSPTSATPVTGRRRAWRSVLLAGMVVGMVLVIALGAYNGIVDGRTNFTARVTQTANSILSVSRTAAAQTQLAQSNEALRALFSTQTALSAEAAAPTTAGGTPTRLATMTQAFSATGPTSAPPAHESMLGVMVQIPAGEFQMGSQDGDLDELPVHSVTLDAFYIHVYEVTNAQFAEFLQSVGNRAEGGEAWLDAESEIVRIHHGDGGWQADAEYASHPVTMVSWYGAQAFCEWRGARLPTEAEWEKAARGGLDGAIYPWGDEQPTCAAGTANGVRGNECDFGPTQVGSYAPNGYGLFDMAGNVYEWVSDWFSAGYYGDSPGSNPPGPATGEAKVIRGGGWAHIWHDLRAADRNYFVPDGRDYTVGFRCADSAAP